MKNKRNKLVALILTGVIAVTIGIFAVQRAMAEPVDPPTGFNPSSVELAGIVDPPTGSPIRG